MLDINITLQKLLTDVFNYNFISVTPVSKGFFTIFVSGDFTPNRYTARDRVIKGLLTALDSYDINYDLPAYGLFKIPNLNIEHLIGLFRIIGPTIQGDNKC